MSDTTGEPARQWGGHVKAVQQVPGIHDVHSTAFDRIGAQMVFTSRARSIMAISGYAGVGKSFATARGAELCANDAVDPAEIVWLEFTVGTQGKALLSDLYQQIAGCEPPRGSTARSLEAEIARTLTDPHRLIVLDEAHHVKPNAMRVLRALHDHSATDFGLVMVGMPQLLGSLPPEMDSRTNIRIEVKPLTDQEIVAVLCEYHDLFTTADPVKLVWLNRTRARGEFRWWANFLANAEIYRPTLGESELTDQIIDLAIEQMR